MGPCMLDLVQRDYLATACSDHEDFSHRLISESYIAVQQYCIVSDVIFTVFNAGLILLIIKDHQSRGWVCALINHTQLLWIQTSRRGCCIERLEW